MSLRCLNSSSSWSYDSVRPHHLLGFYAAYRLVSASGLVDRVSNCLLNKISTLSDALIPLIHRGLIPDFLIRFGIRLRLRNHLILLQDANVEAELSTKMAIVEQLTNMPIAIETAAANEQHYEVPSTFYDLCLGPAKKYSSGLWLDKTTTFAESEQAMLALYCERAGVTDGMHIVDLGCGWGSLTL